MKSRVCVVAAGGTGGHMFPAEALARELQARGWRIVLATDHRGEAYAKAFPAEERYIMAFTEVISKKGMQEEAIRYLESFLKDNRCIVITIYS